MGLIENIIDLQQGLTENFGGGAVSDVMPRGIAKFENKGKEFRCIYTSDSSLLTLFEIHGTRHFCNVDMIEQNLKIMANSMKSTMKDVSCTLQVCMYHDRAGARNIIDPVLDPMGRAAKRLDIDIDIIVNDWKSVLATYTANEKMYLAVWTHPTALVPAVLKKEQAELKKKRAPVGPKQQNPTMVIHALQTAHTTHVANVITMFHSAEIVFTELTPENASLAMRIMFDEEWTSPEWQPWSADNDENHTLPSLPHLIHDTLNHAWVMPETLACQIIARDAEIINDEMVRIGSRIHFPFMNKLQPQQIVGFRKGFFKEAVKQQYPWRICWTIRGGQHPSAFNSALARIMHLFSAQNRKILAAYNFIRDYTEEKDGTPVSVQVTYDTWVDTPYPTKEDLALLRKNQAQFAGTIQAWGNQETVSVTGDPYAVLISSIPGLNWHSPAPQTLAPIEDIFKLLPFSDRAASPWKSGVPFRTPDGKLFPYSPMSTHQAAWISFGIAPMGAGKSVAANVENFVYVFNPENNDIPNLGIIDIGPSSSGLIRSIQVNLPPDKRHYAREFLLHNSEDECINVFDTELGCRKPFPAHHEFLVNFLTLLATPVEEEVPYDGIQQFARICLDAAYRVADESTRKMYEKGVEEEVDDWIQATGEPVDKGTSWWDLTDAIFKSGNPVLAVKAQRHAVPVLEDIKSMASVNLIAEQYKSVNVGRGKGEPLPDYFRRKIQEAIQSYPVLRSYTRFDIGDARIISIDLDRFKGLGAEGSKKMAIMFMVAQQVVAGKFYQDLNDIENVGDKLPAIYRTYHEERINRLRETPKRLCMDEVHRITTNGGAVAKQFVADICTRARESRKWGVSFAFWTQMYQDIPKEIVELTTTLYVLGTGQAEGAAKIVETYDMAPEIAEKIYNLPPPGPHGSSMLALYRTKDGKPYYHLLTLTIGLYMLWALSSTKNERIIRDALTKEFGFAKALQILVKKYPINISKVIEERAHELSKQQIKGNVVQDIIDECVKYGHGMK